MAAERMLALGDYRFSLDTAAYQELRRSLEYRWSKQERLGRRPAWQYLGSGEESIELTGVIYPEYRGGLEQVARLEAEAGRGQPLILNDENGKVWGKWVVLRLEETRSLFGAGGAPRKIEFTLELRRYGEET